MTTRTAAACRRVRRRRGCPSRSPRRARRDGLGDTGHKLAHGQPGEVLSGNPPSDTQPCAQITDASSVPYGNISRRCSHQSVMSAAPVRCRANSRRRELLHMASQQSAALARTACSRRRRWRWAWRQDGFGPSGGRHVPGVRTRSWASARSRPTKRNGCGPWAVTSSIGKARSLVQLGGAQSSAPGARHRHANGEQVGVSLAPVTWTNGRSRRRPGQGQHRSYLPLRALGKGPTARRPSARAFWWQYERLRKIVVSSTQRFSGRASLLDSFCCFLRAAVAPEPTGGRP